MLLMWVGLIWLTSLCCPGNDCCCKWYLVTTSAHWGPHHLVTLSHIPFWGPGYNNSLLSIMFACLHPFLTKCGRNSSFSFGYLRQQSPGDYTTVPIAQSQRAAHSSMGCWRRSESFALVSKARMAFRKGERAEPRGFHCPEWRGGCAVAQAPVLTAFAHRNPWSKLLPTAEQTLARGSHGVSENTAGGAMIMVVIISTLVWSR